ncbi:MAG: DsrE/DsrF/DrsH-like family protein [Spirochaetota bacterium]|nr:DsrE/DsrF/DrsH-like family protein [Spirochaetota bacterium]
MSDNKKLSMLILSANLDKALASFIIATSAASMNYEVNMFFAFWGLNILTKRKGKFFKGISIMEKMLNIVNRGGAHRLALSKLNMLGMGKMMMKMMMKKKNIPSLEELIKMAHEQGIVFFICDMSRDLMGLKPEDFIDSVNEFCGVATFIDKSSDSEISLVFD